MGWKIVEHNRGGQKSWGEILVADKPKRKPRQTSKPKRKKAEVMEPA